MTEVPWRSRWEPGSIPPIAYSWCPAEAGEFTAITEVFEARDLGLSEASAGLISCVEIRPRTADATGPLEVAADARYLFVLEGSATLGLGTETKELAAWSSALLLRGSSYSLSNISSDFRAIQIVSPADIRDAPGTGTGWTGTVTAESPDEYVAANGPRNYFDYRDLQTRGPSEQRFHIHIVRATQAVAGGTGWHTHTMSQWFYILRGTGVISVENHGDIAIKAGDSMCLGVGLKHDVSEFSDDYTVLEMCVPAQYETTGVSEP